MLKHLLTLSFFSLVLYSCSPRVQPTASRPTRNDEIATYPATPRTRTMVKRTTTSTTTTVVKAPAAKPPVKPVVAAPKVITVSDKAATKSVDGRYYYDLQGKRYWKNKRDGKYYLYNKAMYNNKDFQP